MTDEQQQQARLEAVEQFNQGIIAGMLMMRSQILALANAGDKMPDSYCPVSGRAILQILNNYCVEQIEQVKANLPKEKGVALYAARLRAEAITISPPANDWPAPADITEAWMQREEAKRQEQRQQHGSNYTRTNQSPCH